jgi:cytosine/creatinine deaminase
VIDLVLRSARVPAAAETPVDIGIDEGRIVAIEAGLVAEGPELDVGGRLVAPAFVETHIHLDKSCLLDRCRSDEGTLEEAIAEVAAAKAGFTEADVYERGRRTLEKCIVQGTAHMRTHVEVDPVVGLRGIDGVRELVDEYRWAIDIELCVFPQEGLLNNPGTDELMVEALARGSASVVGAAPYTDTDPRGQIDRVFELATEFDVDVDMHLDFGDSADGMQTEYVCRKTGEAGWEGRVTVGHVTQLTTLPAERFDSIARTLAESGVAVTVLPSTDLFLMGRHRDHEVPRGIVPAHRLLKHGVNCSLSTNNVLNPFTPFGDCSLVRMANLFANVAHVGRGSEIADCFDMVTRRSARILRLDDYGVEVGCSGDLVVLDCTSPEAAVAELAQPLYGFKRGRRTFTRSTAELHRP